MQEQVPGNLLAFDAPTFEWLRQRLAAAQAAGDDLVAQNRLSTMPQPLRTQATLAPIFTDVALAPDSMVEAWQARGEAELVAGKVAVVVLNGGMAMRFGGQAKGVETLVASSNHTFLSLRLAQIAALARQLATEIPVAVMHSFATREVSQAHLAAIDWCGISPSARLSFEQSVMPRVTPNGEPLFALPGAATWPLTAIYAAPGHGDTWASLQRSGVLDAWLARGVEHVLVCNVDNLGATVDPAVLGAHLAACDRGAEMSVEVVRRLKHDTGGCVALVDGRPVIVEGFRLPIGATLSDFPEFNTNTLWFRAKALQREPALHWFNVLRQLALPDGSTMPIVQFEQLIGQATELLAAHYLEVDRLERFLPIKTREDLATAQSAIERKIRALPAHAREPVAAAPDDIAGSSSKMPPNT